MPRWLYPGMHIKRWLLLLLVGVVIVGLGAAIFLRDLYRTNAADEIPIVYWLTGAWLEPQVRAALVALLGLALTGIGMWGLMRSVVSPFVGRSEQRHRGAVHEAVPGARPDGSSRSAAAPASRHCCAASRATAPISLPS